MQSKINKCLKIKLCSQCQNKNLTHLKQRAHRRSRLRSGVSAEERKTDNVVHDRELQSNISTTDRKTNGRNSQMPVDQLDNRVESWCKEQSSCLRFQVSLRLLK